MRSPVAGHISRAETLRQRHSLAEGKAEALAGDRIDRAGSIADQCNISSRDTPQLAVGRERSPFRRGWISLAKTIVQSGKRRQRFFQAKLGIPRGHRYTDLIVADANGIGLTILSPINFYAISPGSHAIVPAKGISKSGPRMSVEIGPAAYPGIRAIGPHNPFGAGRALPEMN